MLMIDASVWVNADSPSEAHSAESRAFLDQVARTGSTVVVPNLLGVEVAAAISRSRKNAALALEYAEKLAALQFVRWIPLDTGIAAFASVLAAEHRLRGADAVYAAVAISHGCRLVSLDEEHLTRLTSVLAVQTPAEWIAAGI